MSENGGLSYGEYIPKLEVADTNDRSMALEIISVRRQNMAPKNAKEQDIKLVIRFPAVFEVPARWDGDAEDGHMREYVVNATSYKTLCAKLGRDENRWTGQTVVMVPVTSTYDNKRFRKMHVGMPNEWDAVLNATTQEKTKRSARK